MQGIAKGTLLANRYELTSQVSDEANMSRWIARDEKLGRDVALTVFPTSSPFADPALDSARRVAGLEDHRIVRVLDAGRDDEYAWIIEEAHLGAHTLADLARFDQLHPEEARRIAGETSAALESARARGLHHLQLDPTSVLRLADGSIALRHLAVGAALAGEDDYSSAEANRIDALGVTRLLYFALTGRWAGDPVDAKGVKMAEKVDGAYPDPSQFTENVPNDLNALCRSVLNSSEGPATPGEVARKIAPWPAQMITAPGRRRSDGDSAKPAGEFTVRKASSGASRAPGVGVVGAAAMKAAGSSSGSAGSSRTDDTDPNISRTAAGASAGAAGGAAFAARNVEQDPADATMIGRRVEFDADETTTFTLDDEDRAYARTSYDPSFEELEPPIPGMTSGIDDPDASSRRLAIGLVALFVLGALFLAVLGIRNVGSGGSAPAAAPSTSAPASTPPARSAAPSPSPSATPSPSSSGTDLQLISSSVIGARGYRIADSRTAPLAIDGDPATEWNSLNYRNKSWGGYPNRGGIAIQVAKSEAIKTIKVTPGTLPLTADIYVGDVPGTSGTKVGSVSGATGEQTVDAKGAQGRYITIYVTDMAQVNGLYKASLAEVSVQK